MSRPLEDFASLRLSHLLFPDPNPVVGVLTKPRHPGIRMVGQETMDPPSESGRTYGVEGFTRGIGES